MAAAAPTTMPPEWEPHERTVMGWPTSARGGQLWHEQLDAARNVHALVAAAIAAREPVLMLAAPADVEGARHRCDAAVEVVAVDLDDSWLRDSGPILVRDGEGNRLGIHFGFNGWGRSFAPFDADQRVAAAVLDRLGIERIDATDFVLEGGSIAVDGEGLLVTTERCLLNPNRNPSLDRAGIEARLARHLGARRTVWLGDGIAEDDGTDGHVDNVVAVVGPGRVMLQGCEVDANPNSSIAAESHRRLDAAEVEVTEIGELPYATVGGRSVPVPYANFYVGNGAIYVPTVDGGRARWLDLIGEQFGDRDVVPLPGEVLAYGGGGIHCITQQVPLP